VQTPIITSHSPASSRVRLTSEASVSGLLGFSEEGSMKDSPSSARAAAISSSVRRRMKTG